MAIKGGAHVVVLTVSLAGRSSGRSEEAANVQAVEQTTRLRRQRDVHVQPTVGLRLTKRGTEAGLEDRLSCLATQEPGAREVRHTLRVCLEAEVCRCLYKNSPQNALIPTGPG